MEGILRRAIQYHTAGCLREAEKEYRQLLQIDPNHPEALHLLGVITHQLGKHSEATHLISKALESSPKNPIFYNNLGLALAALNQPAKAIHSYQQALRLNPTYPDAYNNLGNVLKDQGQEGAAVESYRTALQLKPNFPEAHFNLGILLTHQAEIQAAIHHYQEAIRLKPDYAKAYNNLGNALKEQGQTDAAIENYCQALRLRPNHVGTLNNLGNALRADGCLDEAIEVFNQAIQIDPSMAESYCNLGNALKDQSQFAAALDRYRQAIHIKPRFADAHFNRAMVLLLRGNFSEGWKEYEWRLQRPEWKSICAFRLKLPRWEGEYFSGLKLLIYDEQGFGDTLQFIRYLPLVKARGGTVIMETRKQLLGLFKSLPGIDELVERLSYAKPTKEADLYIPLLSLPGIFQTQLDTIPAEVPYIQANPDKVDHWERLMNAPGFKVGLVWKGTNTDPNRSCNLERFLPLVKIPGIHLYGLQKEEPQKPSKREVLPCEMKFVDIGKDFKDFSDTAAAIMNLDLVISIDTSVAHLAGAMGKPVWVLLPFVADWRWHLGSEKTPWYPTMRLFRQKVRGDWDNIIQRVARELQAMVWR